jgi:mRNA interferase MazF
MWLRTDSIIMTDNLATILDLEIDRCIGHLDSMNSVDDALRHTLAL